MFCGRCGTANRNDAMFCKSCANPMANLPMASQNVLLMPQIKSPGLAAGLSFFICGLGQIYNGQIFKGLLMMAAYLVSAILIIVVVGLLTTPLLWIWGMVDAYKTADRLNNQTFELR
jgi:TM2 domain-containing membrane protein YozV